MPPPSLKMDDVAFSFDSALTLLEAVVRQPRCQFFFSFFPLLFIVLTLASMTINVPGGGAPEDLCHTVHLSSRPHILMLKVSKPSALLPPTDQNIRLGGMSGLTSALSEPGQMKRICW